MAKLGCLCGNSISNSLFPNTIEGNLRGTWEYKDRDVWECPECGRLAIDIKDEKGLTIVKWYKPENGEVGNLFAIGTGKELIEELKWIYRWYKEEFKQIEEGVFDA